MKKSTKGLLILSIFLVLIFAGVAINYHAGSRLREAEAWGEKLKEDSKNDEYLVQAEKRIKKLGEEKEKGKRNANPRP